MSRLQFPSGAVGGPQATPVVDIAALQRPMVTPMNDVQVIAMIAASLDGTVPERVAVAEGLVLETMERSFAFSKKLAAVQKRIAAEAKKEADAAADAPQG